nr:seizure protein 6 homolog [Chrysemys picta bellii]
MGAAPGAPARGLAGCLLLLAALLQGQARDFASEEPNVVGRKAAGSSEAEGDQTVPPTPDELEGEVRFVTTAPTLTLLNHHPLLEEFLHEALAKKDYLRQVPFLTWGLGGPGPVMPDVPGRITETPRANLPNQDDLPVFSDLTTSLTVPATAPVTMTSTTALVGEKAEARDAERTPEMVKPAFTAELLTTAAGHMAPWAEPRTASPESNSASVPTEPPITPAPAISQAALPNLGQATATMVTSNTPTAITPTARFVSPRAPSPALPRAKEPRTEAATTATVSGDDEETTTTTIITTTTITTVQVPAPCNWNLTGPEGSLESPEPVSSPYDSLDCTYTISGYPGYGVEIKVLNISLLEGETVAMETFGGAEPVVLANESFLMRGQVIRSPTNRVSVRFRSPQPASPGSFRFRFQAYLLSCNFPSRPAYGDVSVTSLHPGGSAHFYCATGYQLQGPPALTCLNATRPFWSSREPVCVGEWGGGAAQCCRMPPLKREQKKELGQVNGLVDKSGKRTTSPTSDTDLLDRSSTSIRAIAHARILERRASRPGTPTSNASTETPNSEQNVDDEDIIDVDDDSALAEMDCGQPQLKRPFELLIAAAMERNPTQFQLPNELTCTTALPACASFY